MKKIITPSDEEKKKKSRTKEQKALLEKIKWELVCPIKGSSNGNPVGSRLVNSSYRSVGDGQKTLWKWEELFEEKEMDFVEELRILVKKVFGEGYDIKSGHFSGYMGVGTNTWYEICKAEEVEIKKVKK